MTWSHSNLSLRAVQLPKIQNFINYLKYGCVSRQLHSFHTSYIKISRKQKLINILLEKLWFLSWELHVTIFHPFKSPPFSVNHKMWFAYQQSRWSIQIPPTEHNQPISVRLLRSLQRLYKRGLGRPVHIFTHKSLHCCVQSLLQYKSKSVCWTQECDKYCSFAVRERKSYAKITIYWTNICRTDKTNLQEQHRVQHALHTSAVSNSSTTSAPFYLVRLLAGLCVCVCVCVCGRARRAVKFKIVSICTRMQKYSGFRKKRWRAKALICNNKKQQTFADWTSRPWQGPFR